MTIREFIQKDFVLLRSKSYGKDIEKEDDGVYFNPIVFLEMEPDLRMFKKTVPAKIQSLIDFF